MEVSLVFRNHVTSENAGNGLTKAQEDQKMIEIKLEMICSGGGIVQWAKVEGDAQLWTNSSQHAHVADICNTASEDVGWVGRLGANKVQLDNDSPERIHSPIQIAKVQHFG